MRQELAFEQLELRLASAPSHGCNATCAKPFTLREEHSSESLSSLQPTIHRAGSTFSKADERRREASKKIRPVRRAGSALSIEARIQRSRYPSLMRVLVLITGSWQFEFLTFLAVTANSVLLSYQVQRRSDLLQMGQISTDDRVEDSFRYVNLSLCLVFCIEVACRIGAAGKSYFCGRDCHWNVTDLFIVVFTFIEVVVSDFSAADTSGFEQMQIGRLARSVRLVRVLRVVRVMRFFRELRLLISSIVSTVQNLLWTIMFISIIHFVFAILFTDGSTERILGKSRHTNEPVELSKYFGSLGISMYTLFQSISGGIDWNVATEELDEVYLAAFVFYIFFMTFAVLNIVTGLFCQHALETAQQDADSVIREHLAAKRSHISILRKIFNTMDDEQNGVITLDNLENLMQDGDENLKHYLEALDLEVDDAWTLFKLLDREETNTVDVEQFVDGCLRLKGQAKGIDVATMMYESKWVMHKLTKISEDIRSNFETNRQLEERCLQAVVGIGEIPSQLGGNLAL